MATPAQTLPLTYPDIVCTDDLDPLATETDSDLQNLEQDVYHVLVEVLGSNLDDPTRGVGLIFLLGDDDRSLSGLAARIDSQLQQDDRINSSETTITQTTGTRNYAIQVVVVASGQVIPMNFVFGSGSLQLVK